MNNLTSQHQSTAITPQRDHYILEKILDFAKPILMEIMSRLSSLEISQAENNKSVHLSFSNENPHK